MASTTTSMDDILSDKKPEAPAEAADPEVPETPTEQPEAPAERAAEPEATEKARSKRKEHQRKEWAAQGRDPDTGQFVAKQQPEAKAEPKAEPAKAPEKPAAPPAQEMTDKERAAFAKAADESRKRQALEVEVARLRAAQPPAPQPAKAEPKPFWEDPEGWRQRLEADMNKRDATQREEAVRIRLSTSETIARSRYTDFDEKIAKFAEIAASTPGLGPQWLASPDPAEFAYRTGKNHLELAQAGSLDKLKADVEAKARAEERAKVEAEYKAKQEAAERQRAALTPTLSDVRGAAARKGVPVFTGPTAMEDILKV